MKIWILTNDYRPSYGFGIAGYLEHAAKMFIQGGHEVTIFVRDIAKNLLEKKEPGLRIIRFQDKSKDFALDVDHYIFNSKQISEVVLAQIDSDGQGPDIIEVQDCMALGYYLLQKKWQGEQRLKQIPITIMLHTPRFELLEANKENKYVMNDYLISQMEKNCLLAADGLVCPSNFLKDRLQPYVKDKEIKVIPLPFELPDSKDSAGAIEPSIDVLYAGGLEYRKGIMSFLAEVAKSWQEGLNFNCVVIGKPYWLEDKRRMAGDYLQEKYHQFVLEDKLKFTGVLPTDILYSMIKQSKIVAIPSHYDNFPVGCLEAMALGKPVLASVQGGQAEIVGEDGSCGLLFDWAKTGDAKDKLKTILSFDQGKIKKMGENAKNRIQKVCGYKTVLTQREEYYKELLSGQGQSRIYPIGNPFPKQKVKKQGSIKGLLSVVLAVHNPGKYFLDSLRSLVESSHVQKEIIIVNADSNEQLGLAQLEVIRKQKFPGVILIDAETDSLAEARNLGAKVAKGEYLTFIDDNETIDAFYYEKAIGVLQAYDNVSFVYPWQSFYGKTDKLSPTFNTEFPLLLYVNVVGSSAVIYRDVYLSHGLQDSDLEYGAEDQDVWLRICTAGFSGIALPEELSFCRITKTSVFLKAIRNISQQRRLLARMFKKHPAIVQQYALELMNLYFANGSYTLTLD